VAVFFIEKSPTPIKSEMAGDAGLMKFILVNIAEEKLSEKYFACSAEEDDCVVFIVNSAEESLVKSDIAEILTTVVLFIENKFDILFSVGLSNPHKEIKGINDAYMEALDVFEFRVLTGNQDAIATYDLNNSDDMENLNVSRNLEIERKLLNCAKAGDYREAKNMLDRLISAAMSSDVRSLQLAKNQVFALIHITINTIYEFEASMNADFVESLNLVQSLLNVKSIRELKIQTDTIFEHILEYQAENMKVKAAWIEKADMYVRDNYANPNLSIAIISDAINISASHLSRTYKATTGVSLLDHIHHARLEKAKDLLRSEISIEQAAKAVGYLEGKALIRIFRKYEGITPGRYRDNILKRRK
jgi:YesN/AraC family two-component response regulator